MTALVATTGAPMANDLRSKRHTDLAAVEVLAVTEWGSAGGTAQRGAGRARDWTAETRCSRRLWA